MYSTSHMDHLFGAILSFYGAVLSFGSPISSWVKYPFKVNMSHYNDKVARCDPQCGVSRHAVYKTQKQTNEEREKDGLKLRIDCEDEREMAINQTPPAQKMRRKNQECSSKTHCSAAVIYLHKDEAIREMTEPWTWV